MNSKNKVKENEQTKNTKQAKKLKKKKKRIIRRRKNKQTERERKKKQTNKQKYKQIDISMNHKQETNLPLNLTHNGSLDVKSCINVFECTFPFFSIRSFGISLSKF